MKFHKVNVELCQGHKVVAINRRRELFSSQLNRQNLFRYQKPFNYLSNGSSNLLLFSILIFYPTIIRIPHTDGSHVILVVQIEVNLRALYTHLFNWKMTLKTFK